MEIQGYFIEKGNNKPQFFLELGLLSKGRTTLRVLHSCMSLTP
jgi:hypothetical protein